jgi:transcriptional regulator with XRE-family HTH domain
MVRSDPFRISLDRTGTCAFPAYRQLPDEAELTHVHGLNPARGRNRKEDGLDEFEITIVRHSSLTPEWPIRGDIAAAITGFRHALGLSQARFATALGQNRPNIERWEGRKARPFRGNTLSLLTLLRPLVTSSLALGQLVNIAADAVCPKLTRPAATYTRGEIAAHLTAGLDDHRDLAPLLIDCLITSEILLPIDPDDESPGAGLVPLVGVAALNRQGQPWEHEVVSMARRLTVEDRRMWLTLGHRLANTVDRP